MGVQGSLVSFEGVLHGLFGVLVSGEVVFFAVVDGGGAMGVGGLFVEFCCALMGIVGHDGPYIGMPGCGRLMANVRDGSGGGCAGLNSGAYSYVIQKR
jgi:hypothetical protein